MKVSYVVHLAPFDQRLDVQFGDGDSLDAERSLCQNRVRAERLDRRSDDRTRTKRLGSRFASQASHQRRVQHKNLILNRSGVAAVPHTMKTFFAFGECGHTL